MRIKNHAKDKTLMTTSNFAAFVAILASAASASAQSIEETKPTVDDLTYRGAVSSSSRPILHQASLRIEQEQAKSSEPHKPAEPPKSFDVEAIDAFVADQVKEQGLTGMALSIVKDGHIVLSKGYGKRSIEDGAPVEPETAFAIGSVTKQFTCASILLLAEEGKLSVDDKVAKYYPDLTGAGDISLYDLMTHTSGYPDYYPLDFVDRRMAKSIEEDALLKEYAGAKLDFTPGTRWSYSNTGYILLGRVVEKVSGKSFGKFLEDRILKPIGMTHSTFLPASESKERAFGYTSFAFGPPERAATEAGGWIHAAGGLWASAPDLARWDLALMDGRLLKPASFDRMTKRRLLANGKNANYGCGLSVQITDDVVVLSHGGAVSGFLAFNAMVPKTHSAVVALVNCEQIGDPGSIYSTILQLLLKDEKSTEAPTIPKVEGPEPKVAALDFFHQMQEGKVDRKNLGEEFNIYLNDARIESAASRLKALGEPEKVEVLGTAERGGMEVSSIRLTFKSAVLSGALYRSPDGKIQQLLFRKR